MTVSLSLSLSLCVFLRKLRACRRVQKSVPVCVPTEIYLNREANNY